MPAHAKDLSSSNGRFASRWTFVFLSLFLFLFVAAGIHSIQISSPTIDEIPFHTVNGYLNLKTGDFRMNPASPPFAREWVALPWLFLNPTFDLNHDTWKSGDSYQFASKFMFEDNLHLFDELIFSSKCMSLLLGVGLLLIVFFWSYEAYGRRAAWLGFLLALFTPAIIAHSQLATPDIAVTFFSCLFLYFLWRYLCIAPGRIWFVLSSVSLGLAQSSKFTALFLLPILFLFTVRKRGFFGGILLSVGSCFIAYMIVWLVYGCELKPLLLNVPRVDEKLIYIETILGFLGLNQSEWMTVIKNHALYTPIPLASYILGIAGIIRSHQSPYIHFYAGEWTTESQWFYYLWSFAVKMTIAFLILCLIRIGMKSSLEFRSEGRDARFLIISTVILFVLMTLKDSTAVGLRYVLIWIPLLSIFISAIAESISFKNSRFFRIFIGLLMAWHMFSAIQIFPYSFEYFNSFIGGPYQAYRWMRGSDLDWGQRLKEIARHVKERDYGVIKMLYFGSVKPSVYGVQYSVPSKDEEIYPMDDIYIISAHHLEKFRWTKTIQPTERIAYNIFVYDLRQKD